MKNKAMTEAHLKEIYKACHGHTNNNDPDFAKHVDQMIYKGNNNLFELRLPGIRQHLSMRVWYFPKNNRIGIIEPGALVHNHVKAMEKAAELGLITLSLPETPVWNFTKDGVLPYECQRIYFCHRDFDVPNVGYYDNPSYLPRHNSYKFPLWLPKHSSYNFPHHKKWTTNTAVNVWGDCGELHKDICFFGDSEIYAWMPWRDFKSPPLPEATSAQGETK